MERVFYVDDRNGNDSATGLSEEQAWRSLEKVNSICFRPGDRIRLRKGGEWHGMLMPGGSGTASAPIVLEGYDGEEETGKASGEGETGSTKTACSQRMPVIHGDGRYAAILLKGVSHWVVRGIRVTNQAPERGVRQGICVCGSFRGITEDITVTGCEISHVKGENRRSREVYQCMYWNSGIYVTMPGRCSEEDHLQDIIISGNYIHDVYTSGIRVNQQEDFINDIHHTHVVVRGNRIERTGSDGIIVANCVSPLIEGNTCIDAGALGTLEDTRLIAGIWVCATSNALIQRNEVAGTRLFENDGTAFDTDWGTAGDTIFQYNYTHDNQGGFWLDCMGLNRNRNCGKTILRCNISVNDARCLIQDDQGQTAQLYGNLFLNTKEGPQICCHKEGESHWFMENIFCFAQEPQGGWKKSHFHGNCYVGTQTVPESDTAAAEELPFCVEELKNSQPGREKCSRYWDRLAQMACRGIVKE